MPNPRFHPTRSSGLRPPSRAGQPQRYADSRHMISVRQTGTGLVVDICLKSPCVYVDYAGLADLAEDTALGSPFREVLLSVGGTLCLSWAHLLETYGLGIGPTYKSLKCYLEGFGERFVITDCDAQAVIARERIYAPGQQNPLLDVDFIKVVTCNWTGEEPLSITVLLGLMDSDPDLLDQYKEMHRKHRENMYRILDEARQAYRSKQDVKRILDQINYSHAAGTPPTEYLRNQLLRQTILTQDALQHSDGLDFEHAVVALGYCDHVVLDKKWAARVQRFPASSPMARVWKVGEIKLLTQYLRGGK